MKETIKLNNPIEINGEKIEELTLDFNSLTVADLIRLEEDARARGNAVPMFETSTDLQLSLAGCACGINHHEFLNMGIKDGKKLATLARDFLMNQG